MRINLLPPDERPLKQSTVRWEFLVILFGIVLLIIVSANGVLTKLDVDTQRIELENLQNQHRGLTQQQAELRRLQELSDGLELQATHYAAITDRTSDLVKLDNVAQVMDSVSLEMWLDSVELNSDEIIISGYTQNTAPISQFLSNLAGYGYETTMHELDVAVETLPLYVFLINAQKR